MRRNPSRNQTSDIAANDAVQLLGGLRQRFSASPVGAFVTVAATAFVVESAVNWGILERLPGGERFELLLELLINVGVVVPLLVYLFVLPAARNIRRREASERALQSARDELEDRVRERTAELETANRRLSEEADARSRSQAAIEFQAGLLDTVEEAVAATGADGRVRYWNRFAADLYGLPASQVLGRPLGDVVSYIQRDGARLDLDDACGKSGSWSGEVDAERRDGSRFPAYVLCSPLRGGAEGNVILSLDITDRRRSEDALRESEEKYSNLVERAPTGIFILQHDAFEFVNPRFAELVEYGRDELLQADPWQLIHPDDRGRVREIAGQRAAGETVSDEYECRLVTKTGQTRWIVIRGALIRHRGAVATLGNVQDVTENHRMAMELRQLSTRLFTIQEEERRRVARELHDSVGQKLTGIKFLVEAALGAPWPGERRSGMERLRSLVPIIQDAVEEVRRISTALRPSVLDDLGLLPTIVWYLREFAKVHPNIAVEQVFGAVESEIPPALRTPIFRILQEATNNAAKHSGASRLVVGLESRDGGLRLRVQDDGVGFDPGAGREGAGAEGSGLSSMRERAEFSGGAFALVSNAGEGTTVEARWPLDRLVSA